MDTLMGEIMVPASSGFPVQLVLSIVCTAAIAAVVLLMPAEEGDDDDFGSGGGMMQPVAVRAR